MIGFNHLSRWSKVTLTTGLLATGVASCGHKRVYLRIPPRVDLTQYGRVGLVTFTVENAKGQLNQLATQRFSEAVLDAQRIEVLELGAADSVLRRLGEMQISAASAQAIGNARDVPAVFAGHLKVSNVKPSGRVLGLNVPRIEATVSVELTVGLFSAKTGGTLWRASGIATEKVGQLGLVGGEPYFTAKDPNVAYGQLVSRLVANATHDLRPTWEEQRR
ncbi:MAG: hypothetical protein HY700_05165 [Gemmatimonadetes bacterium]|nr:hypothetical protein [Gemmatimonadota bacterium]